MKTSKELKQKIKSIINQLPAEIEGRCPYELMIYTTYEEGQSDLEEFYNTDHIFMTVKELETFKKSLDFYKYDNTYYNFNNREHLLTFELDVIDYDPTYRY